MKTIKELKKKYDSMKIGEVEKKVKSVQDEAKGLYANFIELLFYLERTERFKDNHLYKKSTFKDYLSFEYGVRFKAYHQKRLALSNHPEFFPKHPLPLYSAIKSKCGADKVPEVIKGIEKKEFSLKRTLRREDIQQVIDKHRKPKAPGAPKVDVKDLKNQIVHSRDDAVQLRKIIVEKDGQIAKLKATVERLQAENDRLNSLFAPIFAVAKDVEMPRVGH